MEPSFIKIDVEGYEQEVLKGLDHLPRYLSFEFISEFLETTRECVNSSCFPRGTEFNLIVDDPRVPYPPSIRFQLDRWVTAEHMIDHLRSSGLNRAQTYGEIFVRSSTAMRQVSKA